ncbi:hypothetical protein FRC12_009320 [Ceratobasidium sp. 428]|nr:hypothetical protein FRC12_009320 [Ceratobasidium sp. 428]
MDDRRKSRLEPPKSALAFVDDENRGRRTGKLIPAVHRDEDGFESIEGLFGSQAYSVNDPKRRQKKQPALAPVVERSYMEDEGSDMDITQVVNDDPNDMSDYDLPEAPSAPPPQPTRRPPPRRSSPQIDHVPSPRGSKYFSEQQSLSQSTRRARAPLNSVIHRSHSAQRSSSPPQPFSPPVNAASRRTTLVNGNASADMELDEEEEEEYQTAPGDDAGDEEMEEEVEEINVDAPESPIRPPPKTSPKRSPAKSRQSTAPKAKPRAPTPEPDPDMEDDIAAGLADLDAGPPESDEEPEPPSPPKSKGKGKEKDKGKGKEKASPKRSRAEEEDEERGSPKKKAKGKGKEKEKAKATVVPVGKRRKRDFSASTPPNVRRSQRERFSPLEWWRNEKFVYGRSPDPDEGPLLVPLIKGIERPPKPSPIPLSKKHRATRRGKAVKVKKEEDEDGASGWVDGDGVFGGPRAVEDGMDEETEELGVVMDYATGKEIERRIAFPGARVEFQPTEGPFHFQKIFGDSDFFAAGVMKIPVGGRKPNKPSKENTYVFYCVSGAVEVKVHKSTFVIAPGGMFLAPRGNVYTISNVSQRDAYIFFAQSRKVLDNSDEPPPLPREVGTSTEGKKTKAKVVSARR